MKALVFHGPWELGVEELPDPEARAGEVLIEIIATGICGSDIHGFSGETGRRHAGQVMGHETVGRLIGGELPPGLAEGALVTINPVLSCGSCESCRQGSPTCERRRVYGVDPDLVSAFAEQMVVPTANVVPLPSEMSEDYGALVEPLAVGYHAVNRARVQAADRALVIGGGPIGQAAVLGLRRCGVDRVVVSEPDPVRRTLVRGLGAEVVDPANRSGETWVADVLGGTAHVVIDAVGTSGSIADAVETSAPGARIVLVGMGSPGLELAAYPISTAERSLIGSFTYTDAEFRETATWVGTQPAELDLLVQERVPMAEAADAFTALARGESTSSKILVKPALGST